MGGPAVGGGRVPIVRTRVFGDTGPHPEGPYRVPEVVWACAAARPSVSPQKGREIIPHHGGDGHGIQKEVRVKLRVRHYH